MWSTYWVLDAVLAAEITAVTKTVEITLSWNWHTSKEDALWKSRQRERYLEIVRSLIKEVKWRWQRDVWWWDGFIRWSRRSSLNRWLRVRTWVSKRTQAEVLRTRAVWQRKQHVQRPQGGTEVRKTSIVLSMSGARWGVLSVLLWATRSHWSVCVCGKGFCFFFWKW